MKFLTLALLVGGLMLLSNVVHSQESWRTGPSTTAENAAGTGFPLCSRGITPGATCFWTFNNSTTDSPVINITAEYAVLSYDGDIAATTFTATIQVQRVISAACIGSSTVAHENTSEPLVHRTVNPVDLMSPSGASYVDSLSGDGSDNNMLMYLPIGCYFISPATATSVDSMVSIVGAPVGRQ